MNIKRKSCCFTGHRKIPSNQLSTLTKRLENEILKLIEKGIIYFYTGGALGFDTLVAQTILLLKQQYPRCTKGQYGFAGSAGTATVLDFIVGH